MLINKQNVLDLQKKLDRANPQSVFSAFTYWSWNYYGINIEYDYDDLHNAVIFTSQSDIKYSTFAKEVYDHEVINQVNNQHQILTPQTINHDLFLKIISKQIKEILDNCVDCLGVYVDDVNDWQLAKLKDVFDVQEIFITNSNYLYTREQMAEMTGKKMQKKRNHLNYYLLNYVKTTVTKKLFEIPFKEIMAYLQAWSTTFTSFNTHAEIDFVQNCEEFIRQKILKGIGIYLKNRLIGLIISFAHGSYCEILVEHANKDIRGAYQYLVAQNLKINHPDVLWIDRQDDMWSSRIDQIKRTYQPVEVIKKHFILVKGFKNA